MLRPGTAFKLHGDEDQAADAGPVAKQPPIQGEVVAMVPVQQPKTPAAAGKQATMQPKQTASLQERAMARERDQQRKGAGTIDIADLGGAGFKEAQQKIVGKSGSGAGGGGGGSASEGPPPPPSFAQDRAGRGKGKGKGQQSQTGQGAPGKRKEATSRGNDAERAQPAHKSPKRG